MESGGNIVRVRLLQWRPPLIALALLLGALALHFTMPVWGFFVLAVWQVAGVLLVAGLVLLLWAFILFKTHANDILPTAPHTTVLITTGPYVYTRNPMYLGLALLLMAAGLFFGTLPFFLAAALFYGIINWVHAPFEEQKLERQFGDTYRAYCLRTRRWL